MRSWKWGLVVVALALFFCGSAMSQTFQANQLCMQNGGEFYYHGASWGYPNHGGAKYFPSYAHRVASPFVNLVGTTVYPWKIAGWEWRGMQATISGPTWYWETLLQRSMDNPYATTMSYDYPYLFCTGQIPANGGPKPVYGGVVPTTVPVVGGHRWQFPSSMGGWNAYLNIFATLGASFMVPSTTPFYGVKFAISWNCASALTVPSSHSILEFLWANKGGPFGQYLTKSGDEVDCLGGRGNPGRNYSITCDADNGKYWYWNNSGAGVDDEWAFCLQVCDAITIPVNVPGGQTTRNPFLSYGFDVGIPCLFPKLSTNCVQLGFMTEDYTGLGTSRIVLASFAGWPCVGPYGKQDYRIPHGFDVLTSLFMNLAPVFMHTLAPGYPASMMGTTTGGHSILLPFPADPVLMCAEIRYSSFPVGAVHPMSASYMSTYF